MSDNKYDIIIVPDPILKEVAHEVQKIDDGVRTQLDRMVETMYDAPGIGLAANQVNMLNRVIVIDFEYREEPETRNPIHMVNPEIIWESEEMSEMDEGCLSIPGQYASVQRPAAVRVKYLNYDGKACEGEFEGLGSHVAQHEIDHLNGVLFVDYLSTLKRNIILKKVQKEQKLRSL